MDRRFRPGADLRSVRWEFGQCLPSLGDGHLLAQRLRLRGGHGIS